MKNSFRRVIAPLVASIAVLLPKPAEAVDKVYTGFPLLPLTIWESTIGGVFWSPAGSPTLQDTAIFPANYPPAAANFLFNIRPDGSEIVLIRFPLPGLPDPRADNLVFQNNYLLRTARLFPFLAINRLELNTGNVTVIDDKTATINVDVRTLSGRLTKLGEGTLLMNNTVISNVYVEEGTFGGNATITANLINSAKLAPGNSPGTMHIYGDFKQTGSGHLQLEIASAENFDRLEINGKAKLDGDLDVTLLNGYHPRKGQKITFLSAGDGVSGEFDEVNAPVWDYLTLRAFYEDNRVFLKPVIHSFEALPGLTPNQQAVAHVLDQVIYDERAEEIIHYLYRRDLDKLPGDFDKIAPEELTSIFTISTSLANVQGLNLQRRNADIRSGSSGFSASGLAMQGSGPGYSGNWSGAAGPTGKEVKESKTLVLPEEKKWGVFLTGVGEWVDVDGDGNARGYDITTGGFTLGLDYKVCANFAVGIAAGYAGTAADLTDDGRVWVNGGKLGAYATAFAGGWYADLAVSGGYNSYDTKRSALQGAARGSTDGGELNVLVGTGYDFKVGALTIGPTATFQYTLVGIDGFTERGSLAPLDIDNHDVESFRTAFGFKATCDWKVGGVVVKPELRAAWQHEYGDKSYDLSAGFASGAGDNFLVNGPELGRDSLLIGAGFAVQLSETCSTYLYYDGELGRDRYERHSVSGGVRVAF